jgi:aromatic-L-amino-acid decarboxylase
VQNLRQLGYRAVDLAVAHMEAQPGYRPTPPDVRRLLLGQPLPEAGRPAADILEDAAVHVLPYAMGNSHPRFFGWVNSPAAPIGAFADMLAAAMNPACTFGDHADTWRRWSTRRRTWSAWRR